MNKKRKLRKVRTYDRILSKSWDKIDFSSWKNRSNPGPSMFEFLEDSNSIPLNNIQAAIQNGTFTINHMKQMISNLWGVTKNNGLFDITFTLKYKDIYIINNKDFPTYVDNTMNSPQVLSTDNGYLRDKERWIEAHINTKVLGFKVIPSPVLIFLKELMNTIDNKVEYYKKDQLVEYYKTLPESKKMSGMKPIFDQLNLYIKNPHNRITIESRIVSHSTIASVLLEEHFRIEKYCYDIRRALTDLYIQTVKEFSHAQSETNEAGIILMCDYFDNESTREIGVQLVTDLESNVYPDVYKQVVLNIINKITDLQK